MSRISRRTFVRGAVVAAVGAAGSGSTWNRRTFASQRKTTGIRVESMSVAFEEVVFRSPLKFAGVLVDRQTMSTATCTVRTVDGRSATGFGVLPLNYTFTFPSGTLSPAARLNAMQELATELARVTAAYEEYGHPIDINWALAPQYDEAAATVSRRLKLTDPIPRLCTLVTAGAIDAAIHDAYGKLHRLSSFHTYGPEFMTHDLSRYLGPEFRGEYPNRYVQAEPRARMPLCHLVGAVDPLSSADVKTPLNDGLPESLADWMRLNGLFYFKIKLNGDDLDWDVDRMRDVERVVAELQHARGVERWAYIPDFNEKCPNVDYYLAFLKRLQAELPDGFRRIEYVEQPTHRDLAAPPENDMRVAAQFRPVVVDESVIDALSVLMAKDQGWSGIVVKSPKGLTRMLLMAAVAGKQKLKVVGGDMSCPGAALIQTAAFQARLPGVTNIEANARQFLPTANAAWESRFPGMFRISDGLLKTDELVQPGLGA